MSIQLLQNKNWLEHRGDIAPMFRIALLLGVLVHLLGFFFFRVVSNPLPSRSDNSAFLSLIPADQGGGEMELIEQASLFDSAPLFIPGKWSAASQVFSLSLDRKLKIFPDYEPRIELLGELKPVRLSLINVVDVQQPSDLLDLRFWDLFDSFGEGGPQPEPFEGGKSTALVSILMGNGESSLSSDFRYEVDLQAENFGVRPTVYYLSLSGPGLPVGAPVLWQSSGSDALDAEVLEWLLLPATLANLPTGYLEIRVFP